MTSVWVSYQPVLISAEGRNVKLKLVLAVISFVSMGLIFDWYLAAILLMVIWIHEQGHIWAIKRIGHNTLGFYFIPLLGGVTLSQGQYVDRTQRVFVYIMGPVFGLASGLALLPIYFVLGRPPIIIAAIWITVVVNLLNLIPIKPLDGGYVVEEILSDIDHDLAYISLVIVAFIGIIVSAIYQLWVYFAFLMLRAFTMRPPRGEVFPRMLPNQRLSCVAGYMSAVLILGVLCWYCYGELRPLLEHDY